MTRVFSRFTALAAGAALLVVAGELKPRAQAPLLSLSVSKETAAPGGMAQVKVFITEPTPVSTGGGSYTFDAYASVDGIALMNELEDVAGIALVRGTQVNLSFTSPSATFGMDPDYPVLTVAGRIPANAAVGVKYPLVFDASSLQVYDASGNLYAIEAKAGHLITAPGVSIHDVVPGSAVVPAGGTVTIRGSSFDPRTEIKFKEVRLSGVTYVSPNEIRVTVATTTHMHGQMIRAANPDGTRSVYFSYQRTRADSPSTDPVLQFAVPLVPPAAVTAAEVGFPAAALATTYGIGVQNIETADAAITFTLVDAAGNVVTTADALLPPSRYIVRELSELFGVAPDAACTVRVSSSVPVQVIGATADQTAGTASPILPR